MSCNALTDHLSLHVSINFKMNVIADIFTIDISE